MDWTGEVNSVQFSDGGYIGEITSCPQNNSYQSDPATSGVFGCNGEYFKHLHPSNAPSNVEHGDAAQRKRSWPNDDLTLGPHSRITKRKREHEITRLRDAGLGLLSNSGFLLFHIHELLLIPYVCQKNKSGCWLRSWEKFFKTINGMTRDMHQDTKAEWNIKTNTRDKPPWHRRSWP